MSVTITCTDIVKRFGSNTVIPGLNLEIKESEFFTLLGPSGCGKTTLLRMVAGFNSIEGGTISFNDKVINNIALPAGVPIIAGEAGICAGCGVATLSISYYDLGYVTGEMAYKVLTEGADISQLPIEYAPNVTRMYNPAICDELGIQIPEGYEPIG